MGKRNSIDKYKFYYQYITLKTSKTNIMELFDISLPTFHRYVVLCTDLKFDITKDFLSENLYILFKNTTDEKIKIKLLSEMMKIWEKESKVPVKKSKKKLDISVLSKMGDPTAKTA